MLMYSIVKFLATSIYVLASECVQNNLFCRKSVLVENISCA